MSLLLALAVVSLLVSASLFVAMRCRLGLLKPGIVLLQFTFTEGAFRRVLERWGQDGVRRFSSHFPLDYGFLTAYAVFGASLGTWVSGNAVPGMASAALLPWLLPGAAVFDAVENQFHQRHVDAVPGSLPRACFLAAGLAASAKWLLILAFWPCAALVWAAPHWGALG
ncbi:hypothetical protein LPB72_17240 [Hydrogenophaga crassostreae]|uniref:DUF1772 domain-containing protein n=1 Tax=Hydrogenophaga crassostreae TaxID=1763535 RepID=A0A167GVM7_9BURK|nr:hypothetical protein [Hydrogenophaga crassostreae]AOW12749.1 hypothetical protein LPB072_07745 [Hydrogenophaga crassostreae]OAD39938.1 hypothetical protein LPB72_17240 [Hydrogenophaga crassostreae]